MAAKAQRPPVGTGETPLPLASSKKRYWELDFIRGFCVILMVIDHFFFSASAVLPEAQAWAGVDFWQGLNHLSWLYWDNYARHLAWIFVVSAFLLICGISCTLSRSNFWRGLKAACVALAITFVTWLLSEMLETELTIWFGVIHMYACAMLIYSLLSLLGTGLKKLLIYISRKKEGRSASVYDWVARLLPGFVGLVVLILYFGAPWGHFTIKEGFEFSRYPELVSDVMVQGSNAFKNFVALFIDIKPTANPQWSFASADYFPLVPYVPMVLIGSLIGQLVYHTRAKTALKRLDGKWNAPVKFAGRHALFIYVLHQIAIVAFFFLAAAMVYIKHK